MHYAIFRKFIPKQTTDNLVQDYENSEGLHKPVELPLKNESNVMTNTKYKSNRSKGLEYAWVNGYFTETFLKRFKLLLLDSTGLVFDGNLAAQGVLPVFKYGERAYIKAHKDLDKTKDEVVFQDHVALVMLTQRGDDFYGGRFYLNPVATHSDDGKEVYNDKVEDRIYPNLDKGDVLVWDNTKFIHGVETTFMPPTNKVAKGRLTCSIRTK